jgi:DNA-binding response OmpR family regulator
VRILVIEDEPKVARALSAGLRRAGYEVAGSATGEEGFILASAQAFDLILLDLMLPGRDGLEVLGALRGRGVKTPVLVLTARDAVEDRVQGLDSGADDYLVKPFAFPELLARIRVLLRRGRPDEALRLGLGRPRPAGRGRVRRWADRRGRCTAERRSWAAHAAANAGR